LLEFDGRILAPTAAPGDEGDADDRAKSGPHAMLLSYLSLSKPRPDGPPGGRSEAIGADDLGAVAGADGPPVLDGDGVLDVPHGAVGEADVDAARVVAARGEGVGQGGPAAGVAVGLVVAARAVGGHEVVIGIPHHA